MPISENIKKEIERLDILDDEKKLLFEILEHEDSGIHRYKETYQKLIDKYLAKHAEEVNNK